jgi:hypothetical protein
VSHYCRTPDSEAFDAAGAGAMLCCMVNFGLMIFVGVRQSLLH